MRRSISGYQPQTPPQTTALHRRKSNEGLVNGLSQAMTFWSGGKTRNPSSSLMQDVSHAIRLSRPIYWQWSQRDVGKQSYGKYLWAIIVAHLTLTVARQLYRMSLVTANLSRPELKPISISISMTRTNKGPKILLALSSLNSLLRIYRVPESLQSAYSQSQNGQQQPTIEILTPILR